MRLFETMTALPRSRYFSWAQIIGKDGAGGGDALKPRGGINPVAHQIAVAFLDYIAEMNADAELDAALGRQAGIALDRAVLHFDRATHSIDHAAELDEAAVAGTLNDAPVMGVDRGTDQIATQLPEPRRVRSSSTPASRL
jgi:hypothetical protein